MGRLFGNVDEVRQTLNPGLEILSVLPIKNKAHYRYDAARYEEIKTSLEPDIRVLPGYESVTTLLKSSVFRSSLFAFASTQL